MTKYFYETQNGKICGLNEKQTAILTKSLWRAIEANRITLIRFPDGVSYDDLGNNRSSFDYAVYTHGINESGEDIVIRYYVSVSEDGRYSTDPIPLSYNTFLNDVLTWGDTLSLEDSETGEVLKAFASRRGV